MAKTLQDYVKYTRNELESYTLKEGSCVLKINRDLHFSLGAYCLADFKNALMAHIASQKVGFFDIQMDGIVLDVKNIKVIGTVGALRADDPRIHVNINADCYVFRPQSGAVLSGVVKHIGNHHVGVIIYRVFNASIRFESKLAEEDVQLEQSVLFRIREFKLQNVFPYIKGELLLETSNGTLKNKLITFETDTTENISADAGIDKEEKELDDLISLIKKENAIESVSPVNEAPSKKSSCSKATKRQRKITETTTTTTNTSPIKIKIERNDETKKRKIKDKGTKEQL